MVPLLIGTALLIVVRRRGARAWLLLAAVGLALGLITIVMPVSATATVATTMTLATMHLITGLVWSSWSGVPPDKGLLSAARSARAIIKT